MVLRPRLRRRRRTKIVATLGPASSTPEVMARYALRMQELGVDVIGSCCGSTPAHTAAMREALGLHAAV